MVTLNGLPPSWDSFNQIICGRKELPKFNRLWVDCVQEEARVLSKKILHKSQDEENKDLASHARKGKGRRNFEKKNTSGRSTPTQRHKRKDLSKIKYYNFHNFGHYVS